MASPKLLIIGLGNPLLGDDGVGWKVIESLQPHFAQAGIEFDLLAGGGLSLMERLVGYEKTIIVDSIYSGSSPTGTVISFPLEALANPFSGHLGSAHETSLHTALAVGRKLGAILPDEVLIVAIESPAVYDFNEELTPAAQAAVPVAAREVLNLIDLLERRE
jgi:hydrogenase maturation protease